MISFEITDFAERLQSLARDYPEIQEPAKRMKDDSFSILILRSKAANVSGLRQLLETEVPGALVKDVPLAVVATDPCSMLGFQCLVVAGVCGEFWTGEELTAIERWVLPHPTGSRCFVMTNAEDIGEDDLDIVERGCWNLLTSEPRLAWKGQDLSEYGIFLWRDSNVQTNFDARCRLDLTRLAHWLHQAKEQEGEMKLVQLTIATNLLLQFSSDAPAITSNSEVNARSLVESVVALRRRWIARLDADATSIRSEILTSLATLEHHIHLNLIQDCDSAMKVGQLRTSQDVMAIATRRIEMSVRKWAEETSNRIGIQQVSTSNDNEALLTGVNWDRVNDLLGLTGFMNRYPDALDRKLKFSTINLDSGQGSISAGNAPSIKSNDLGPSVALGIVGVAGTLLIGASPIVILAGGIAGLTGGKLASQQSRSLETTTTVANFAQRAAKKVIGQLTDQTLDETKRRLVLIRHTTKTAFDSLEQSLRDCARTYPLDDRKATGIASKTVEVEKLLADISLVIGKQRGATV